jgi:hypothetical protein
VTIQHEAPMPQEHRAAGALIGVQSTRETHEFSSRGAESRQTIMVAEPAPRPSFPSESQGWGGADQRRQR